MLDALRWMWFYLSSDFTVTPLSQWTLVAVALIPFYFWGWYQFSSVLTSLLFSTFYPFFLLLPEALVQHLQLPNFLSYLCVDDVAVFLLLAGSGHVCQELSSLLDLIQNFLKTVLLFFNPLVATSWNICGRGSSWSLLSRWHDILKPQFLFFQVSYWTRMELFSDITVSRPTRFLWAPLRFFWQPFWCNLAYFRPSISGRRCGVEGQR